MSTRAQAAEWVGSGLCLPPGWMAAAHTFAPPGTNPPLDAATTLELMTSIHPARELKYSLSSEMGDSE